MDSTTFLSSTRSFLSKLNIASTVPLEILLPVSYLLLVRYLRFRRLHRLERKYATLIEDPYAMSYKTAQEIRSLSLLNEMPFMSSLGGQGALLKTYTIASGTKLLVQTRQLSSEAKVAKRMEDTSVLGTEITMGDIDSERAMQALAKLNWLHSRYKKVISNEEMLHTLSVSMLEPIRYIDRFEWRRFTKLEKVATFVFWREIGLRMGIRDIPETVEALQEWTANYEKHAMVLSSDNRILADTFMALILRGKPKWAHRFLKNVNSALLEERVLRCLGWPDPPRWVAVLVESLLYTRAWMVRNLFLPRLRDIKRLPKMDADGRIYRKRYAFEPWYIKDNTWTRWSIWLRSKGKLSPGPDFKSNGYLPEELGPIEFEKMSKEPVKQQADAMREYIASADGKLVGCPFAFGDELCWG
jgi:hypothetical protein